MQANRRDRPQSAFNVQRQTVVNFLGQDGANIYVYDHQIEALNRISQHFADPNPGIALVVLPTGCGKTGVAVMAPYVLNATRVMVITPSLIISQQIYEAFCGDQIFFLQRNMIQPDDQYFYRPSGVCIKNPATIRPNLHQALIVVNAHKIGGNSRVQIEDIPDDNYDLVIVDEAHHYPAPTWRRLVDHFPNSKRLFLTATPYHENEYILPNPPCYSLQPDEAVRRGVIRPVDFIEATAERFPGVTSEEAIAQLVWHALNEHDQQDPQTRHQAMVLTQTIEGVNAATDFVHAYRQLYPDDQCEVYVGGTPERILARFKQGEIRVLVIVGRLLEGFDRKQVSVAAIVRNIAFSSRVLFTQFVGRAIRKLTQEDPVRTKIVTHERYKQRMNFEQFDRVVPDNMEDIQLD